MFEAFMQNTRITIKPQPPFLSQQQSRLGFLEPVKAAQGPGCYNPDLAPC